MAKSTRPRPNAAPLIKEGLQLLQSKRYGDALLHATRAAAVDENYLPTYQLACLASTHKGQLDLAQSWCSRGLAKFPHDHELLYAQARIYAESGKIDEALRYCQKALAAKPDFAPAFRLHEFMRHAAA